MPADAGAVYRPEESTVPPPDSWTDQVTAVDWPAVVPVTVAVNVAVPPTRTVAVPGDRDTATTGVLVTEMVAVALFDGSATLVATTWNVPTLPGAL